MSSTIYYKGTLKDNSKVDELYDTVLRQSSCMHCKIVKEDDSFYIEFTEGQSEPLLFQLNNRKLNWFCKWNNPANPDEYYKIFDLLIAIKPFFKSLRVDDDEGAWNDYLLKSKPCKIHLRQLSGPAEVELLERDFDALNYDFSVFMKPGMQFFPYSKAVYCVIVQDFLRVFKVASIKELNEDDMIDLANNLQFEECARFSHENFAFQFPFILLLIWIGYCLAYKGRVYQISSEVRGLKMNRLAAQFGILSIFLNIHSGIVNTKHAEMKRFADAYINTNARSDEYSPQAKLALSKIIREFVAKNNIDTTSKEPVFIPVTDEFKEAYEAIISKEKQTTPHTPSENYRQSLEVLVSILDYLGFQYVGVAESENK